MRAMRAEQFSGYEALKLVELPNPAVTDGKVLVRITAAGVTPLDHTILIGDFHIPEKPLILGNEGAGVVEEGGGTDFPTGSRVMFWGTYGAFEDGVPPRGVALSSMGANRTSGVGNVTALSLLEQGFRSLPSPVALVRAGGFFENFLFGLEAAQGGTLPVFYSPTNRKSTMVASDDIGAEVATLLTGPAWSGHRVIELGSMVSADEVAGQLG